MIHILLAAYNEQEALGPVLEAISLVSDPALLKVWVVIS